MCRLCTLNLRQHVFVCVLEIDSYRLLVILYSVATTCSNLVLVTVTMDLGIDLLYPCTFCNKFRGTNFKRLLHHIRFILANSPNFSVRCGIDGCERRYEVFESFRKHIQRKHSHQLGGRLKN